jgi:hypothetical protein
MKNYPANMKPSEIARDATQHDRLYTSREKAAARNDLVYIGKSSKIDNAAGNRDYAIRATKGNYCVLTDVAAQKRATDAARELRQSTIVDETKTTRATKSKTRGSRKTRATKSNAKSNA